MYFCDQSLKLWDVVGGNFFFGIVKSIIQVNMSGYKSKID